MADPSHSAHVIYIRGMTKTESPVPTQQSLMGLAMTVSCAVGILLCCAVGIILIMNARNAIEDETISALHSARTTVNIRMPHLFARPDTMGDAMRLSDEIDALRHVSSWIVDRKGVPITVRANGIHGTAENVAPEWFIRLVAPEEISEQFVISHYPNILGHLVVTTDPSDEIAEVWEDFRSILPLLAMTGFVMLGLTLFVSRLFVSRLSILQGAVSAMQQGDISQRAPQMRIRELAALGEGINDLATFLEQERAANRMLQKRILNLSEAERAKIAFDLHDEMGPLLFALNLAIVQAQNEAAGLEGKTKPQLAEALTASAEHARSVQDRARAAINDLRPMLVGHATLPEVLSELIAEFTSFAPGVSIELHTDLDQELRTSELAEISIYRFIRESMLNSIRHGHAKRIDVCLSSRTSPCCHVLARVTDNGTGPSGEKLTHGYGLAGINDRALALGAVFIPPHRQGRNTATELRMPCQ